MVKEHFKKELKKVEESETSVKRISKKEVITKDGAR
jgi:hypothetical protein